VTVSYVAHVRGLATPAAAFATERMRVAVPSTAARLAADTPTQSMPEEQAPAHASIHTQHAVGSMHNMGQATHDMQHRCTARGASRCTCGLAGHLGA
jgi:hypothetical protein